MNSSIHQSLKLALAPGLTLLAALAMLLSISGYATAAAKSATGQWVRVPSPNASTSDTFRSVDALASNDVWAVGQSSGGTTPSTLTAHWDGSQWTLVASPNSGTMGNNLYDVAAISSSNVWAVGYYTAPGSTPQTLVERWNGTAWSIVPSPVIQGGSTFNAIAAASSTDIWAVGNQAVGAPGPTTGTLVAHWNGSSWTTVSSPNVGTRWNDLRDVTVISPTDVWAVGSSRDPLGPYQALVVHWDGTNWSVVDAPSGSFGTQLFAVTGLSASDVWASGVDLDSNGDGHPYFLHWTGSGWQTVPSPGGVQTCLGCYGDLAAIAPDDIWAVGGTFAHWDGVSWSLVSGAAVPGASSVNPVAVDAISSADAWAVGSYFDGYDTLTLTERWQGQEASTATATSSATTVASNTPTATQTAQQASATPSNTPGATATVCNIQFTDVSPDSTFYAYIKCLACRGVFSGYADGTFRPANNVTRGQAAKIIANAAEYSEGIPSTRQTFKDVEPGSTFWLYIERVAAHGAIGGYADGTFRPSNNVTRGQLAKIDTEVRGYNDAIPSTRQTFKDVEPGSTFWLYIERAALHGVIGGYADGTFRPGNDVTRGQAAKIVSNTFFPNCQTP